MNTDVNIFLSWPRCFDWEVLVGSLKDAGELDPTGVRDVSPSPSLPKPSTADWSSGGSSWLILDLMGGLRWLSLGLVGWLERSWMTLGPLLLEGYSKTQENHHNPTLTSAIRPRYHSRGSALTPRWRKWSSFQNKPCSPRTVSYHSEILITFSLGSELKPVLRGIRVVQFWVSRTQRIRNAILARKGLKWKFYSV